LSAIKNQQKAAIEDEIMYMFILSTYLLEENPPNESQEQKG
jgi:hypothetical protein